MKISTKLFTIALLGSVFIPTAVFAIQAPVVSGGVGDEEETRIEQVQNDYNTKLVFTGVKGAYVADVDVTIRDKNGVEVLSGASEGPIVLTELKPGRYVVEAETQGYTKERVINIGEKLRTYHIQFPVKDEDATNRTSAQLDDPRHFIADRYAQ